MMEYKGVEIVRSENKATLRHSLFTEVNHNADYYEMMRYIPLYDAKNWTITQEKRYNYEKHEYEMVDVDKYAPVKESWFFKEISRVYSVASRNYQICNGGYDQYLCNEYHKPNDPYHPGGSRHYGRGRQLHFICGRLREFAKVVLTPEEFADYEQYIKISKLSSKTWEYDIWNMFPNVEHSRYIGAWDVVYYEYNGIFEQVLELYAQYLVKKYCKENLWAGFQVLMQSYLDNIRVVKYRRRHGNEDFRYVDVAENFGKMFA